MRIIGGKYRGRKLGAIRSAVRPTSDRLRESLFNVVGDEVCGSVWVDLFAGSGAVGIEALSRGADLAVFVEKARESLRLIETNLKICEIESDFLVVARDAFSFLRQPEISRGVDFVFLDPPYAFSRYHKLLRLLVESSLWRPSKTIAFLEIFKKTQTDFLPESLQIRRRLQAGDSHLLVLEGSP